MSSLYAWRRRLTVTPAFVEAKVAPGRRRPAPRSRGVIEVRLRGGRRVRVSRENFDRELLVEVVAGAGESAVRGGGVFVISLPKLSQLDTVASMQAAEAKPAASWGWRRPRRTCAAGLTAWRSWPRR